jgi:hypothetical protein
MPEIPDNYVKLRLRGPDGEVETPWAERIGDNFRLDNLPWFAYGISDDDIVEATATEQERVFEFVRVITPSGNRLVRVLFEDRSLTESVCGHLKQMGCHYEGYNKGFVAVSIPPTVALEAVCGYLIEMCIQWESANPNIRQSHSD